MSWVVFAFSGPVLWAISVHLDKYLVERFFKESNVAVMLLFTAFVGVLPLPFIWLYEPSLTAPGARSIALIILDSCGPALYGRDAALFAGPANRGSLGRRALFPGRGAVRYGLAYLVRGETLTGRQLAGGAMIVIGALIVSIRFTDGARLFKTRLAALMLTCGFATALSGLIFKIFAIAVEFWTTTFWMYVGEALFGCALLLVPKYRRQLLDAARQHGCAIIDQRLQRAHQSRRRARQSLRADVRAVKHRSGHRLDDDVVRLCLRRRAQRPLAEARPR
ncbi:MAG TPA: hypothetical protein VE396_04805 [Xanthobacteraceae bacterium]|nr:hypothetical protein [Xanthobacteraceae bacterium]